MPRKISAETLREKRKQAGISQWAVAKALGRSQGWVSIRECGYQQVSESEAVQIASAIESVRGRGDGKSDQRSTDG